MNKIIRHKIRIYFYFFLFNVLLIACKKTDLVSKNPVDNSDNVAEKVSSYLESQKIKTSNARTTSGNRNANIDVLEGSLDFNAFRTEPLDNRRNLLIVPIKDELIVKKNLEANSTLCLLLITDKKGKIGSGSIVYFLPADGKKRALLPNNTLSNMINGEKVDLDGRYKMLSLTGTWISQFQVKNGKLFSAGNVQQKNDPNKSTQKASARCIDWYLVTTYYWDDGSVTREEQYITTTCDCGNADDPYATPCNYIDGSDLTGGIDEVVSGNETISSSESTSTSEISDNQLTESEDPTTVSVTWNALLGWSFDEKAKEFTYVNGNKPWAVPGVQPFRDRYGRTGTVIVYCSTAWQFSWQLLTQRSALAHWDFFSRWDWTYSNGVIPKAYPKDIMKVFGPL